MPDINPITQKTAGEIILETAKYINDVIQNPNKAKLAKVRRLLKNLEIIPVEWRDSEWIRVRLALMGLEDVLTGQV